MGGNLKIGEGFVKCFAVRDAAFAGKPTGR